MAGGSIFKGIRISELEEMKIIKPPKAILELFNARVADIYMQKEELFKENEKLREYIDFFTATAYKWTSDDSIVQ
ncbi:hypothetical protein [Pseudobutyrivibrio xylanivorans]|uniref:Restriction endonuclease subunit S n=1 Tax=Pseudobutyrivibrio xylanivorans TaxID=185007 RepID=A0A5P6VTH2_PSEXY|nr:hypothetical protein [Pseudobutyrivibrio xylanivorans]QFJ56015.1 restriction endonuclease subunit S [Pseudobutyrivibrio xylanivorans]